MEDKGMDIGQVVLAKAGRDKGKLFVIVGKIDEEYVLIANGTNRSIDKPKKKKIKHLDYRPEMLDDLKMKLENGQKVFDAEIRKSLEMLGHDK
jgi:large subunit ribosomal protein L14e